MFKSKEAEFLKKQLNLQEILLQKKDTESLKLKDGKRNTIQIVTKRELQ